MDRIQTFQFLLSQQKEVLQQTHEAGQGVSQGVAQWASVPRSQQIPTSLFQQNCGVLWNLKGRSAQLLQELAVSKLDTRLYSFRSCIAPGPSICGYYLFF